ncbi:hypothetical protein [Methylobacterium ajmalii]|uniref:hypothetical protein n=1 Tax=Methylobacterium ajmalii TaxID=2738439 RepID=UPI002F34FC91
MSTLYRWCRLDQGSARAEAWLPLSAAVLGAFVQLPEVSGLWWVQAIGCDPLTLSEVKARSKRHGKQFLQPDARVVAR